MSGRSRCRAETELGMLGMTPSWLRGDWLTPVRPTGTGTGFVNGQTATPRLGRSLKQATPLRTLPRVVPPRLSP
jgi:hypothetical protein